MISYFVNCECATNPLIQLPVLIATIVAIGIHVPTGVNVWRIPFGLQLVPAGIMAIGLLSVKVSLYQVVRTRAD